MQCPGDLTIAALDLTSFVDSVESSRTLNEALADLARYIEQSISMPIFASVLLLDESGKRLYRGAAPSLPESYCEKIDGIEIGPNVGSCGTAVFSGHSIFVVDIDNNELWANYKDLALKHGLRACWSVPIFGSNKNVLGTFALYYPEVRNASLRERAFIEECAEAAARLIENRDLVRNWVN